MANLSQYLGGSSPKVSYYTSGSNTFTKPTNVQWISVLLVGGGGGSGPDVGVAGGPYGGGGGGEVVWRDAVYLTGNATISIGAGGTHALVHGSPTTISGAGVGETSFQTITAAGGLSSNGPGGNGGGISGGTGGGAGGAGSSGTYVGNRWGGGGGGNNGASNFSGGICLFNAASAGTGGSSAGGGGSSFGVGANTNTAASANTGGGAGGSITGAPPRSGGSGLAIVYYIG